MTDTIIPLVERLPQGPPNSNLLLDIFLSWTMDHNIELYPAQEEAVLEVFAAKHVILNTPTGSGKSLVGVAQHLFSLAHGKTSYYTSPIKALVNEKFFSLCRTFGAQNVGLMTGDATVNRRAPIICCTAEILAALSLADGSEADIHSVVMDEFHYYGDRDRGIAWQIPLLRLPDTSFLLMSATLGDPRFFGDKLKEQSSRPVAIVRSTNRPVPLDFQYSTTTLNEKIEELSKQGNSPIYVVNFTQRECSELAQNLMSLNVCTKEEKKAIAHEISATRFNTPFGKLIRRYLSHGVAIHHAGLLPRYRSLVENLAQKGLLKIICGTDTLGVGINVPIRTVLFTKLCKYDGQKTRLLKIRDFKQIAGRAGRKGFDDRGLVVCQAPVHVIENLRLEAKAAGDVKKKKKLVRKKTPERGYAHWDEAEFKRLIDSDSEPLKSRFTVNHSMLVSLLQAGHGYRGLIELIHQSHESDRSKSRLRRKAKMIFKALRDARILEVVPAGPTQGAHVQISSALQDDFSIHHSLSLFLIHGVGRLNPSEDTFHLKALSFAEAILEDPRIVLLRQQDKLRRHAYASMKAEGVDYDERQEKLEKITWPMPDSEQIYEVFEQYLHTRPWLGKAELNPKSIARDMYEKASTFNDYINEFGLEHSEGVLLRYLNQAYKTLVQNIPTLLWDDHLHDVIAYLRECVAQTDRSLFKTWQTLNSNVSEADESQEKTEQEPIDRDQKSFRARVRAELRSLMNALSNRDYEQAIECLRDEQVNLWSPARLEDSLKAFYSDHDELVYDHRARAAHFVRLQHLEPGRWQVTQVMCDPNDENNWYLDGIIDLRDDPTPEGPLIRLSAIRC